MLNFHPGRITVPWKPHAKQRPRHTKGGHTYTAPVTRNAEKAIAEAFIDSDWDGQMKDGPISVHIELFNDHFVITIEDTDDYENRRLRGDVDNYAKTILDSLNGVAWEDDKQIRFLTMEKH